MIASVNLLKRDGSGYVGIILDILMLIICGYIIGRKQAEDLEAEKRRLQEEEPYRHQDF